MFTLQNFGVERFESKLKNGVRVVLFHRPNAPIFATSVLHSGSCFDPQGKEGMAHLIEHMIVNGSAKFPSKDVLSEHIESVGGLMGAMTNSEIVRVNAEVPDKEDFSRILDVFEATLCEPFMDKKIFETEKDIVKKEITRSQSNAERVLYEAIAQLMFKNTPFEHKALGSLESISAITYDDMVESHKKFFDSSRLTFVVSGDISIQEITDGLNALSFFSGQPYSKKQEKIEPTSAEKKNSIFLDLKQVSIYIGLYGAPVFSKESLCISLAGSLLAGGRTSRLVKKLRYDKGLIYAVNPVNHHRLPISISGIVTDTSIDKVQVVIDEVVKEIKNLHDNGITEREMDFVKNKAVKSLKRSMQTSASWVDFHAYGEALAPGKYSLIHEFANQVTDLKARDINDVIKAYISPEKLRVAVVGKINVDDIQLDSGIISQ